MESRQSNNLCQTQRLLRCQCREQNLSQPRHVKPKLSACQDTTKWSNEEGNVYLFLILVNSPFTQRLYQTLHMDPQHGRRFQMIFFIVSTTVLLSRGSPEALCLILAFIRLHSGRGGCCHLCPKLGPDISRPTCVTLCAALPSPLCPITFPPLIISTLHRSSAALLLWAVICSAIVQYILPPRSHCRRPRPPPPPTPPPAAISISVRPDFTASWICTFSSRLHNLVTASSLPAVSCCVCVSLFLSFFFLKMWCVVALFFFFC